MSWSRKRARQSATAVGALLGVIVILTFVISLIAPGSKSGSNQSLPTFTPFGTLPPATEVVFPPPEPNPHLEGELPYIHSSGYFQTFRPAGSDWIIDEGGSVNASSYARVVIQSSQRLAVIHNYIQPGVEYESLDSLSKNFLTEQHFAGAWADYESWQETGREITADSVIVNFDLVAGGKNYLARTTYRPDGSWLFVTRLVVPGNNPGLLDLLQKLVIPAFVGYHDLLALPEAWPAYIDQQLGFVLKHPPGWVVVAGDKGRPVTFSIASDQAKDTIRVWTVPDQAITSSEEAQAWVKNNEPGATVLGANPIQREAGNGFQVAYAFRDTAGDAHSGLIVLLNDHMSTLFVANLQIVPPDLNLLNAENLNQTDADARQAVADGFIVLPDEARQPVSPPENK
jgi:hypothetical protein